MLDPIHSWPDGLEYNDVPNQWGDLYYIRLAPSGSTAINVGADYTNSISVTITNSISNAHYMRFSNDGVTWSDWKSFATTKVWSLTAGDGTKTVYAEFREPIL